MKHIISLGCASIQGDGGYVTDDIRCVLCDLNEGKRGKCSSPEQKRKGAACQEENAVCIHANWLPAPPFALGWLKGVFLWTWVFYTSSATR